MLIIGEEQGTNRASRGVPHTMMVCVHPAAVAGVFAGEGEQMHEYGLHKRGTPRITKRSTPSDVRLVPLTRGMLRSVMVCVQPAAVATLCCGAHGVPSPATTHMASAADCTHTTMV